MWNELKWKMVNNVQWIWLNAIKFDKMHLNMMSPTKYNAFHELLLDIHSARRYALECVAMYWHVQSWSCFPLDTAIVHVDQSISMNRTGMQTNAITCVGLQNVECSELEKSSSKILIRNFEFEESSLKEDTF